MKARVKYSKGEEVKYVGHLDTMRTFIRCIKRTAIPVKYSSGFNPRVQISFALPLGVGLTSDSEYFDLEIQSKMNESVFLGELNSVLPQGFKALSVEFLDDDFKKSLMSQVKEAVYEIYLETNFEESKIENLLSQDEIMIEKESKGKHNTSDVNIKEYILDYSLKSEAIGNEIITIHSTAGSVNNMNPNFIIQAIENKGGEIKDFSINRKELILR